MAASPAFISAPRIGRCSLSTANTATDGTGTITDLIVGVAAGTRVLSINVQGTATTVAALVNIFLYDGTNYDLFDQFTISATTGLVQAINLAPRSALHRPLARCGLLHLVVI